MSPVNAQSDTFERSATSIPRRKLGDALRPRGVLHALAAFLLAGGWMIVLDAPRAAGSRWTPAWPDVVLAHLGCMALLARAVHRRLPTGLGMPAAAFACCGLAAGVTSGTSSLFLVESLQRSAAALFSLTAGMCVASLCMRNPGTSEPRRSAMLSVAFGLMMGLVVPGVYAWHQCERELAQFGAAIGRQRPVAALRAAGRVLALHAEARWNGQQLKGLADELEATIEQTRQQLAWSGSAELPASRQLERCRLLAALEEWDEAVAAARPLAEDSNVAVPASLFLASLSEERGDWAASRRWHGHALHMMGEALHAPGEGRAATLQGLGFAEQNLGHFAAAEAAYLESMNAHEDAGGLSLLSGLYAEAHNVDAAREQAARAAELNPQHAAARDRLRERALRDGFCIPKPSQASPPSDRSRALPQ